MLSMFSSVDMAGNNGVVTDTLGAVKMFNLKNL